MRGSAQRRLQPQELVAHPEKYKEQRAQEIEWWRKNVLEKKGKSVASP